MKIGHKQKKLLLDLYHGRILTISNFEEMYGNYIYKQKITEFKKLGWIKQKGEVYHEIRFVKGDLFPEKYITSEDNEE